MSFSHRHLFSFVLFGCTSQPSEESATTPAGDPSAPEPGIGEGEVELPTEPPATALVRGLGHDHAISEAWLDARASSALTLDLEGGVRLWPALPPTQADLTAFAPIRVPVREPLWLSHARAGERTFVVAAIDTAQIARVLEIQLDDAGAASVRTRFETSPHDPLLELHVLDGGERLVGLGVDHRIRLYDGRGQLLSELSEYGLAPWQLRLTGPPEAPQLAMVLAGPTRLQRFTIQADKLAKHGEARAFTLDRGPNGNDLALLPSGRTAAVLRRPEPKGPQFSLELHDLDTGEVRVLWGEIEAKWRPRLHILDDERALLEDGVAGYFIDLRQAVLMPLPFELPEELEKLPPESHVAARRVALPGTDRVGRWHTSVVAGVRVVPNGHSLILDPIDSDRHHELGHRSAAADQLDFAPDSDLLALAYHKQIIVESLGTGVQQTVDCASEALREMVFTDADHLLVIEPKHARLCAVRTGQEVAKLELPEAHGVVVRPSGPGTGEFVLPLASERAPLDIVQISYANGSFGTIEPIGKSDLQRWPEFPEWAAAVDAAGNRYVASSSRSRTVDVKLASGETHELEVANERVDVRRIEPSPDGRSLAIVTRPMQSKYGSYYGYGGYGGEDFEPSTLTVWTTSPGISEAPQLRWSTSIDGKIHDMVELTWTDDGSRLAYIDDERLRVVTPDAEVLLDRSSRDFHLAELPSQP